MIQSVIGNVVSHDLDLPFQGQILMSALFRILLFAYFAKDERHGINYY